MHMEPSRTLSGKVRFGVFEADLGSGELRKRGRKVELQDQPFQVLALLLRHHGGIGAREELQRALWPADTFIEFEHGINTAIKKLRQALGMRLRGPTTRQACPLSASDSSLPAHVRPAECLQTGQLRLLRLFRVSSVHSRHGSL
jgi:hypothetical protein